MKKASIYIQPGWINHISEGSRSNPLRTAENGAAFYRLGRIYESKCRLCGFIQLFRQLAERGHCTVNEAKKIAVRIAVSNLLSYAMFVLYEIADCIHIRFHQIRFYWGERNILDHYNMCPDCRDKFGLEDDGGNGFCVNCTWKH